MSKYYIHVGKAGKTTFDIADIKAMKKSDFVEAHKHIPGAADLYHDITGKPKAEKVEKADKKEG